MSTAKKRVEWVDDQVDRNIEQGWEEPPFLIAIQMARPVRYVMQKASPTRRRGGLVDSATVCAQCIQTARGKERILWAVKAARDGYIRILVAPEKVNPRSKRTACLICGNWAFPELYDTPKETSDEN